MFLTEKEPEFGRRGRQLLGATGLAALLQGGIVWAITELEPHVPPPTPARITMRVVKQSPPAPKAATLPPPAVETVTPAKTKPKPKPKTKPKTKPKKKKSPTLPAPMPTTAPSSPEKAAAPPPLVVGLTLSSTTQGGKGPRIAVGNTLMGTPDSVAKTPVAGPMVKAKPVPPTLGESDITEERRVAAKLRSSTPPFYPPEAKRDGLQGVVVLSITINPRGHVSRAQVLRGLDARLDASAVAAAKNTLWSPATVNGHPIVITRRFNVRFTLQS